MERTIHLPPLEPWQIDPFNDIIAGAGSGNIYTIVAHRQCGKSILAEIVLIYYALTYPGTISVIIEPTNSLNRKIFREIVNMLDGSGCIENANNGLLEITFTNKSMIQCKSAESRDNLRGATTSGIQIYDEAAFLKEDIFNITLPFTNVHRAPILLISTPLFKNGFFYESYIDEENYSYDWSKYDTSKYLTPKMLEKFKKKLPAIKFMQEYLGLFADLKGSVFGDFGKCLNNSYNSDSPIETMGIDWGTGSGNDYTAISLFNKEKLMVGIFYFNNIQPVDLVDKIYEIYQKYKPKTVVAEKNSIGNVYGDLLKRRLNKPIILFNTTNESKNKIIDTLVVGILNNDIQLMNDPILLMLLARYERLITKSGKVTYNNDDDSIHDDLVIATALAYYHLNKGKIMIR